MKVNNSVRN